MLVARDHTMDYNGGVAHAFYYGLCSLPGFADDEKRLHGVVVALGVLMLLLVDGSVEVNGTFETLVRFQKGTMASEVAKILFPEG